MKRALLVIDIQELCVGENHDKFFNYDDSLLSSVNSVISENSDSIIVYIRSITKKNFINKFAPFKAYEGSREAEFTKGLNIVSENVFIKYKGNAFENEKLDEFLKASSVDEVELIGVDGTGCVALTAKGALKHGYKVILNDKAIGTMRESKKEKCYAKLQKAGAEIK